MKRLIRHLPKPILVLLILLLLSGTAYAAYLITTITGEVKVEEAITVSPVSFTMTLYPGESKSQEIELTNASSVAIAVSLNVTVTGGLDVIVPDSITVKKDKTETFEIEVRAPLDIEPGTYTIKVEVRRG